MIQRLMLEAALTVLTIIPASAAERPNGRSLDPHGPCYMGERPTFDLFARANCRCPNGRCLVLECSAEVGGNIEFTKGELRARLEAQARLMSGEIIGSVEFSLRKK